METNQALAILQLVGRLRTCLATRDSCKYDALFEKGTLKAVTACHDKLRYSLINQNDSFIDTMNRDFAMILRRAGSHLMNRTRQGLRDDPDNLQEIVKILRELSSFGAAGHFRDPDYRLLFILNEVTTWLEQREQSLRAVAAIPLPKFA